MLINIGVKDAYGRQYGGNELWDGASLLISGTKNLQRVPLGSEAGLAYCRGGVHSWPTHHPSGCLLAGKVRTVVTFLSLLSSFSIQFFIDPFHNTFYV